MTAADQAARSGEQERHLALSTLVQQSTYVTGTVVMLVVVTALARTLSLSAFGVYGLMVSLAAYLLVAQGAVEAAAVRAIAQATTAEDRDRVFSMAMVVYLLLGLFIGTVIAGGGNLLLGAFEIPHSLQGDARVGLVILGGVTWVGWPLKTFQDVLRGSQLFVWAATAESIAFVLFGLAMGGILLLDGPLWLIIGTGGVVPALTGGVSAIAASRGGLGLRYRHGSWDRAALNEFLQTSRYLFVSSLADLFIYSLDRVILGFFRPAATVALYEGPVRAHNVVRQVQGVLALTVLPAGSRYLAENDDGRARELIVRGTRYTLLASLPLIVVFMVLAQPILVVWLGAEFGPASTAMTILVGYWLVATNTNVPGAMLVAVGRARELAAYAWATAAANLALSLALTPSMGLNGVVLGTMIPNVVAFPVFMWMVTRWLPVSVGVLASEAWAPAYGAAAVLAAVLVGARLMLDPNTLGVVLVLAGGGVLATWLGIYAFCLRPSERTLIADILRHVAGRVRGLLHLPAR